MTFVTRRHDFASPLPNPLHDGTPRGSYAEVQHRHWVQRGGITHQPPPNSSGRCLGDPSWGQLCKQLDIILVWPDAFAEFFPLQWEWLRRNNWLRCKHGCTQIADLFVPARHRQLRCENQRANLITVLANLPEIPTLWFRQRRHGPIIDHHHINPTQPHEQIAETSVGACHPRDRETAPPPACKTLSSRNRRDAPVGTPPRATATSDAGVAGADRGSTRSPAKVAVTVA